MTRSNSIHQRLGEKLSRSTCGPQSRNRSDRGPHSLYLIFERDALDLGVYAWYIGDMDEPYLWRISQVARRYPGERPVKGIVAQVFACVFGKAHRQAQCFYGREHAAGGEGRFAVLRAARLDIRRRGIGSLLSGVWSRALQARVSTER